MDLSVVICIRQKLKGTYIYQHHYVTLLSFILIHWFSEQQLRLYTGRDQVQQYTKIATQKQERCISTEATTFDSHCRSMKSLEWASNVVFCSGYSFLKSESTSLTSKYVFRYSPRPGFPYFRQQTHYPPPYNVLSHSVGWVL